MNGLIAWIKKIAALVAAVFRAQGEQTPGKLDALLTNMEDVKMKLSELGAILQENNALLKKIVNEVSASKAALEQQLAAALDALKNEIGRAHV